MPTLIETAAPLYVALNLHSVLGEEGWPAALYVVVERSRRLYYRFTPAVFAVLLREVGKMEERWWQIREEGKGHLETTEGGRQLTEQLKVVAEKMEPLHRWANAHSWDVAAALREDVRAEAAAATLPRVKRPERLAGTASAEKEKRILEMFDLSYRRGDGKISQMSTDVRRMVGVGAARPPGVCGVGQWEQEVGGGWVEVCGVGVGGWGLRLRRRDAVVLWCRDTSTCPARIPAAE